MMVAGDYTTAKQSVPRTKSQESENTGIKIAGVKVYVQNGEAVISANETIKDVQVVSTAGQILASKRPNVTETRMALAKGVNFVTVQTESDVQTFKLMND